MRKAAMAACFSALKGGSKWIVPACSRLTGRVMMQRRAITNRDSAILDSIIQRELVKVVNTASAINQIVAMEGLRRMRIWP